MALTRSTYSSSPRRFSGLSWGKPHERALERAGLIVSSLVFLLALALVCAGRSSSTLSAAADLQSGRTVNLNALAEPGRLLPLLGFLQSAQDRELASARIFTFAAKKSLPNVGALSGLRVTESDVKDQGSVFFERFTRSKVNASARRPASIPLLTPAQLSSLKPELVVRTPAQAIRSLILWSVLYFVCFWGVHLVWSRVGFAGDQAILPSIQLLTGIGLVLMVSLRDPLRDTLAFANFAEGICGGCCLLLLLSFLDFESLLGKLSFIPLLLSLVLSVLLLGLGHGPGASGAKVNLGPFQPVEVIKILLVFFLAGYFARNWEFLRFLKGRGPIARRLPAGLVLVDQVTVKDE